MRVGIKQLTSIVKNGGDYQLVQGSEKATMAIIKIIDISSGGLCIESKCALKKGVSLKFDIPKIKDLPATEIECAVTRSVFVEDPLFHINLGTDKDKSYHEIGLKYKIPNTQYLKQLYKLAVTNQI